MALPANMHEQLEKAEARLHLLPADEAPPAEEERARVQRWQEHVHEAAEAIRRADDVIEQLAGMPDVAAAEREALAVMQRLNPDQAWFWTEEWQAGEREVDRQIAAGEGTVYYTDEDFEAALKAHMHDADTGIRAALLA